MSPMEEKLKRILLASLVLAFAAGSAMAQAPSCTNPVSKDGKPLAGAAKTSSIKACCEKSASVDHNGKPLAGAAHKAKLDKCLKDAS